MGFSRVQKLWVVRVHLKCASHVILTAWFAMELRLLSVQLVKMVSSCKERHALITVQIISTQTCFSSRVNFAMVIVLSALHQLKTNAHNAIKRWTVLEMSFS